MSRYPQHVEEARKEAESLGATFEVCRGKRHYIATIGYNGKCRKTSISVSPSDWRINKKIAIIIRRYVTEMSK